MPHGKPGSTICCSATYGIGVTSSNSGVRPARTGSASRAKSSAEEKPTSTSATPGASQCCSGAGGAGGAFIATMTPPLSRGSVSTTSRARRSASAAWSRPQKNSPTCTSGPTWCSSNSNSVTTPKFPPPPRSAQYRSGYSRAHDPAVGQHDLTRQEVVNGKPELAVQPTHPAAQRQAAHAGVADHTAGDRQPVGLGRRVHFGQRGPAADPRAPRHRIDRDLVERAEVDHQA